MLESGGGSGYAGTTNWYRYDVEAMWRMLANQQTDNYWRHAAGWRKTSELTDLHRSRLSRYRDALAEVWPPERSAAARAYIDRLNYLISAIERTHEAASANYTAFAAATSAISSARHKLKAIYDEYMAKKAAKAEQDRRAAAGTPTPSPLPSGERLVTQADLDRLNNQARAIMYELSGELVQAQVQIRQPPPYRAAKPKHEDPRTTHGSGSAPPVLPPVVPVPTLPSPPSAGGPPPAPPQLQVVPTPTPPSTGPILGGTTPPPAPPSPIAPPVITPTPTPPPSSLPPGVPTPLPPGASLLPKPGMPGGPPLPSVAPPVGGGPVRPGATPVGGLPKAMPPGGMIGAVPGAGLGQPASTPGPARRINPVGGLIGGGGKGLNYRPTSGSTSGMTPPPGVTVRSVRPTANRGTPRVHSQQSGDPRGSVQWDPDNPWATDSGVAPVVTPPPKPGRIDPGPAIGSNR